MTDPMDTSPMIIQGPDLPVTIEDHCVVNSDNEMKAFIIGGNGNGVVSSATHIFSFDDQTWQQGPSLIEGRYFHACGILKDGNDYIIVVAGGAGETTYLSSVELYNLRSGTSWYAGPDMANHM